MTSDIQDNTRTRVGAHVVRLDSHAPVWVPSCAALGMARQRVTMVLLLVARQTTARYEVAMNTTQGGFRRCPRCGTMQGPVPACPACGWAEGCSWCEVRCWVPGFGWQVSAAYPEAVSHGICPWCATTSYGAPIQKVAIAAERLRVSAGLLEVSACRLHDGSRYVTITDGRRCGWAGRVAA